jgi:hypothetical protein
VPSLFFFMALTAYCIKSGLASILSRPLDRISQKLFRLPGECAVSVLLALLGGYPIGAGCAAMFRDEERLSASQAEKTACIAVAAGPGFLINYVGSALAGSREVGGLLLAAQAAAVILTGVIAGYTMPSEPAVQKRSVSVSHSSGAFTESVRSAGYAAFSMCSVVLIFSAVTEILQTLLPDMAAILSAAAEITTGADLLTEHGAPLPLLAFFLGFGGLAVHCQIFAVTQKLSIDRRLFFLYRIICGIITAALTYTFLMVFPIKVTVFRPADAPLTLARSANLAGSGALILASLCFVGSVSDHTLRHTRR